MAGPCGDVLLATTLVLLGACGGSSARAPTPPPPTTHSNITTWSRNTLEFYPGFFGLEDSWQWDNPRNCAPSRRQEWIDNTRTMRQAALTILRGLGLVAP